MCMYVYVIDSVSRLLPHEYEEYYIRVYSKHKAQGQLVQHAFDQWCQAHMHTYGSPPAPAPAPESKVGDVDPDGAASGLTTPITKRFRSK